MIKLFYMTIKICFCIILSAIHKCDQHSLYMYFYIIWKISNTVRPSTDVSKGSVKYPAWRFFTSKKRTLEIYFGIFFCQNSFCRTFCLTSISQCYSANLFFKSRYLWFSSEQFKEDEYIIFCYLSVSVKLLLSAEKWSWLYFAECLVSIKSLIFSNDFTIF